MGVSGELRYFGCSSAKARPAKATTLPLSLVIGKMTRRRKRSKWNLRFGVRDLRFQIFPPSHHQPALLYQIPRKSSFGQPSRQSMSVRRSITQPETCQHFIPQATVGEIRLGSPAFHRSTQLCCKKLSGEFVYLMERCPLFGLTVIRLLKSPI